MKFYSSVEVSLGEYRDFLQRFKIERVTIDYMQKREDLYDNSRF
jgi:hypothetical protein